MVPQMFGLIDITITYLYQVNVTQQPKWAAVKGPVARRRPYHVRTLPQIIAFSSLSG
jgi:hypothetical protein